MKKILTSVLMMFIFTGLLYADIIKKTYHFNDYKIINHGEYISFNIDGCLNTAEQGKPAIPYCSISLLIEDNHKVDYVEITPKKPIVIDLDKQIAPMQYSSPLSKGSSGTFLKDESVYTDLQAFPTEKGGAVETASMNGYEFLLSSFTPVEYSPVDNKITLYQEVTITVHTSPMRKAGLRASANKEITSRVAAFAQNPEMLKNYSAAKLRTESYDMLIVTGSSFVDGFADLTSMYQEKGFRSLVVDLDSINTTMTGTDTPERIRNFIIQEYNTHDIQFVLLGGDVEVVPYRGFYCEVQSSSLYTDNDIPADLYYSALDGTWNDDNDNNWGEPGEDDLLPDIAVARMTFNNANEQAIFVHKSTQYQTNPVLGELKNPLMAGEDLYSGPQTWGAQYLELLIGYHEDNGYTTNGIPENHNIEEMYDRDMGSWSKNDIINRINSGKQFVHHSGHANASSVMRLNTSDITNANFSQANGVDHNYTLVYTHGCICGAFDESDCIAERMVGIDNMAVAGAFNSRYGWFNEGQTEGPSAHMHREFVDALYNDQENHIGTAHMISKIETSPWVTAPGQHEEGALRWCFYDCNMFGDPALAVWTDEPMNGINAVYEEEIPVGWETLNVKVTKYSQPIENYRCALLKDGVLHGSAITDADGNAQIQIDPLIENIGDAQLVISGYNILSQSFPVGIVESGTPVVNYSSFAIRDENGNNNGQADYGETFNLDMELKNIGYADAHNVVATLSTTSEYATVTDSEENFGDIEALGTSLRENAYTVSLADNVPDQNWVMLSLHITADELSWDKNFIIQPNAPKMLVGEITIDDAASGNGNNRLDPGENARILIRSYNKGHADAIATQVNLTVDNEMVVIANGQQQIDIGAGKFRELIFDVQVNQDIPLYSLAHFNYSLNCDDYTDVAQFTQSIGFIDEDFESGNYSSFDWAFDGTAWEICTEAPYEGNYCSMSGDIGAGQESVMQLTLDVLSADTLSFFHKESTEDGYDKLSFSIDGNKLGEWSGIHDWSRYSVLVDEGIHSFSWMYKKDMFEDAGEDKSWVDEIIFPPVSSLTAIEIYEGEQSLWLESVYPNPVHEGRVYLNIGSSRQQNMIISVHDMRGSKISEQSISLEAGIQQTDISLSKVQAGVYYISIQSGTAKIIKKIIVN